MATYPNGRIPLTALTPIGGGLYLEHHAAVAWIAARAVVYAETGIMPKIIPDGAYRDIAGQVRQKQDAIDDGVPNRAATPGTSTHGTGISIDINNIWQYNLAQLERIMARFGFRRNIPFESWHFTYDGSYRPAAPASESTTEIRKIEDEMIRIIPEAGTTPPAQWLVGPNNRVRLNPIQFSIWPRYVAAEKLSTSEMDEAIRLQRAVTQ